MYSRCDFHVLEYGRESKRTQRKMIEERKSSLPMPRLREPYTEMPAIFEPMSPSARLIGEAVLDAMRGKSAK